MQPQEHIVFGPFRFALTTERLWREEREIPLRARAKAVLRYLQTHPGHVIPREEFAQHVWAETQVNKTALRNGWFTEGFDTGDLQEARALLEDLSS